MNAEVDLQPMERVRTCACGCGVRFVAKLDSRRIYYSRKHRQRAKNLRRQFKLAGVL